MEENLNPIPDEPKLPEAPPRPDFTAHGRELIFGGVIILLSVLLCNFVIYGSFNLGFALAAVGAIGCSWVYLKKSGANFGRYEKALLILSMVIAAGFARSSDGAVKFFLLQFVFVAVNLALCLGAGQNRRSPRTATSLLDAPRAFFRLGFGNLSAAGSGLASGVKKGGAATRRIGAVGTGLLISVPILVIMVTLLIQADAAFEGLMDLLPEFKLDEYLKSAFWGCCLGAVLYSRGVSLTRSHKPAAAARKDRGVNALTVNTVLVMVCFVYAVYLVSQLAYLSGGLSGILPEEYTMAQYARRGFFEMAWLCTINLGLICGSIWLIRSETGLPRLTKIAGAFIAAVTVFLILTASAKMFLYIGSYGLTWSRVITEVIMLWLAITTILVTVRLFLPNFGYMKAVMLSAMVLGALVIWVDVESLVAGYNVKAYRSGRLETVDVSHLDTLGAAGIPWLLELEQDADPEIAQMARDILNRRSYRENYTVEDFRDWNRNDARAEKLLADYYALQNDAVHSFLMEKLDLQLPSGRAILDADHTLEPEQGRRFLRIRFTPEEDEQLRQLLEQAGWTEGPIGKDVRTLLVGANAQFNEFKASYSIREDLNCLWFFADLHPEAEEIPTIHIRDGYRFLLAYYDFDLHKLVFFEMDNLEAANQG